MGIPCQPARERVRRRAAPCATNVRSLLHEDPGAHCHAATLGTSLPTKHRANARMRMITKHTPATQAGRRVAPMPHQAGFQGTHAAGCRRNRQHELTARGMLGKLGMPPMLKAACILPLASTACPPLGPWRPCMPSSAGLMKQTMQCALLCFQRQFISTEK